MAALDQEPPRSGMQAPPGAETKQVEYQLARIAQDVVESERVGQQRSHGTGLEAGGGRFADPGVVVDRPLTRREQRRPELGVVDHEAAAGCVLPLNLGGQPQKAPDPVLLRELLGRVAVQPLGVTAREVHGIVPGHLDHRPPPVGSPGTAVAEHPVLELGYLVLARWINNEQEGQAQYEKAINTFKAQTEDESKKGDAEFGISQLEKVKNKYLKH